MLDRRMLFKSIFIALFGWTLTLSGSIYAANDNWIEHAGIIWHLESNLTLSPSQKGAKPYTFGQLANGGFWIVGEVEITKIEPAYTFFMRVSNTSLTKDIARPHDVDAFALNSLQRARTISKDNPLILTPGTSLICFRKLYPNEEANVDFRSVILTCIDVPIPHGLAFSQSQYDLLRRCSDKKDCAEWNSWRNNNPNEDIFLQGVDLSHFYLENVDLHNSVLSNSYLRGTNLKGANLSGASLDGANLEGALLKGTDLTDATLKDSNFFGVDLGAHPNPTLNMDYIKSEAKYCDMKAYYLLIDCAKSRNIAAWNDWRKRHPNEKIWLKSAKLSGLKLKGANLSDADFSYAMLDKSVLVDCNMNGCKFINANLCGAELTNTKLNSTDFRYAAVDGFTSFKTCSMEHYPDFRGVTIDSIRINSAQKEYLIYCARKKNWESAYPEMKFFKRKLTQIFWWISDYGSSTLHIIKVFFYVTVSFTLIYFISSIFGEKYCIIENLLDTGEVVFKGVGWISLLSKAFYFSIVTMTTLGFGDMHAKSRNILAHIVVIVHVACGYVLLGALITRLGMLFASGGPW